MSKEDRFALLNTLSFNDKFFDNENEEYLDSLDIVRILNHYDKTLSEFVKRDVEQQDKIADLEAKLAESQKPKEIRFNGFVADCNYDEARKVLQEDILKMQAENKKLKESEELNNYAKCILENKKLEEDLELSEKCCIEYEEEIAQLKQQLAEKEKEIEIMATTLCKYASDGNITNVQAIIDEIDNQIKQLKEGK